MRDGVYENASAVMHMSSDTEVMENFAWLCQEMWAQVIELMIGIAMLSAQLGWWSLMPLVIIAGEFILETKEKAKTKTAMLVFLLVFISSCFFLIWLWLTGGPFAASSQLVRWTGRLVSESMVGWQKAKQDRIAFTISMIDYIKSIKMVCCCYYSTPLCNLLICIADGNDRLHRGCGSRFENKRPTYRTRLSMDRRVL